MHAASSSLSAAADAQREALESRARNVAQFEQQAVPFAAVPAHSDAAVLATLLDAAGVQPGLSVLDVACGPGLVSLAAATRGARVTGADVTPACVDAARRAAAASGSSTCASFVVAPAEALPLPSSFFDVVLCRYTLHHMTAAQQAAAVGEMSRVAVPGGAVVLCDVAVPDACHAAAYDALERLRDPSHFGVVRGGAAGLAALLREAGLVAAPERCASYDFCSSADAVLGASFPEDDAAGAAWLATLRSHGPGGGLGIRVDMGAGDVEGGALRYAVPVAVEVATKPPA